MGDKVKAAGSKVLKGIKDAPSNAERALLNKAPGKLAASNTRYDNNSNFVPGASVSTAGHNNPYIAPSDKPVIYNKPTVPKPAVRPANATRPSTYPAAPSTQPSTMEKLGGMKDSAVDTAKGIGNSLKSGVTKAVDLAKANPGTAAVAAGGALAAGMGAAYLAKKIRRRNAIRRCQHVMDPGKREQCFAIINNSLKG